MVSAEFTDRHCSLVTRDLERSCLCSISQWLDTRKTCDRILLSFVTAKDTRQLRDAHQLLDGRGHVEQLEFTPASRDSCEYRNQFSETFSANRRDAIEIQENLTLT